MSHIFVAGHRNPDTDAACSAYCYAWLKNRSDPENKYEAVLAGPLQAQAKLVFGLAAIEIPPVLSDLRPKVADIVPKEGPSLQENDPVGVALRSLDGHTRSIIPVFGTPEGPHSQPPFVGLFGMHEAASFVMDGGADQRPKLIIRPRNFDQVMTGRMLQEGTEEEFEAPLMIGAMPLQDSIQRSEALLPARPLLIVGRRWDLVSHALEQNFPGIVLTGLGPEESPPEDLPGLKEYKGWIYISALDTAETLRLLRMSVPVKQAMNRKPASFTHDQPFDEARTILLGSDLRGMPVFKEGQYIGVVTRRNFLDRPKAKVIMVDHNEPAHGIAGIQEAEVLEIIDHHRLAPGKTALPIYVYAKPLGSSCTIVWEHFRMYRVEASPSVARLMLAGILSDTLGLRSPTTTDDDRVAAQELAIRSGTDLEEFTKAMLDHMPHLAGGDAERLVAADFKEYPEADVSLGIGQIEVGTLDGLEEERPRYLAALDKLRQSKGLAWALLLITHVSAEHSVLLSTTHGAEKSLGYSRLAEHCWDLPGILSRKKQLLPEILRVATNTKN